MFTVKAVPEDLEVRFAQELLKAPDLQNVDEILMATAHLAFYFLPDRPSIFIIRPHYFH